MKTILKLISIQLGSTLEFINIFSKGKKSQKKSKGAFAILLGAFIFFSIVVGIYSFSIGQLLQINGRADLLPGMMMAIACVVMLITTIYKANDTLFSTKDYDMLMSLPVKTSYVISSRVLVLYILNIFFAAVILIPSSIVYGILVKPSALYYIYTVVGILFVPLVPMIIASIIGILLGVISSRFKHKNIINVIIVILFFGAFMFFYFSMSSNSQIADIGVMLEEAMERIYPLVGMYVDGTAGLEILKLLLFVAISLVAFVIFSVVVGKVFVKVHTMLSSIKAKTNYKFKGQKVKSPVKSLIVKEFKRLISSVSYAVNSTVGLVMLIIGLIAIAFIPAEKMQMITTLSGDQSESFVYLVIMVISLCTSMVTTSACSVSLEGKNLWVIKSLPISAKTYFRGKILFNMLICAPFIVIATVISSIILKANIVNIILMILVPLAYNAFGSVLGLRLNLRFPNLDWTNETVVVKQSIPVMITLFAGMIIAIVPAALMFFVPFNPQFLIIGMGVVLYLVSFIILKKVDKRAEELLINL